MNLNRDLLGRKTRGMSEKFIIFILSFLWILLLLFHYLLVMHDVGTFDMLNEGVFISSKRLFSLIHITRETLSIL